MKITMEHEGGTYSVEEDEVVSVEGALELLERLLICAGFSIQPGTLELREEKDE